MPVSYRVSTGHVLDNFIILYTIATLFILHSPILLL